MNAPSTVAVPPGERRPCYKCGSTAEPCYSWHESSNGTRRIKRTCPRCGRSGGFAPTREPFISKANEAAVPTAALDVLIEAEALGITLRSDGKGVDVGGDGWKHASPAFTRKLEQCRHQLARLLGRRILE